MKWWLFIVSLLLIASGFFYPLHQDEAVFLGVARGITQGKLPYKDITDNKPPGIYYLLAAGQKIFGEGWRWIRAVVILTNIVSAYGLWRLTKNYWVVALFFVYMPLYQGQFALTEVFMLPWLLWSTYFLTKTKKYRLAGLLLGVAFLFKQTAVVNVLASMLIIQPKQRWPFLLSVGVFPLLAYSLLALQIPWQIMGQAVATDLLYNYEPTVFTDVIRQLPGIILPLSIYIVLILHTIYMRYVRNDLTYFSIVLLLLAIPLLIYRPYHHYWVQFLPYIILGAYGSPLIMIFNKPR